MQIKEITDEKVVIVWDEEEGAESYRVYWADADTPTMKYRFMEETTQNRYELKKATHVPHFLKVSAVKNGEETACSEVLKTPVKKVFHEQLEKLNRGLVAIKAANGIFISWRLFLDEATGYDRSGLTGTDFYVYRNGEKLALDNRQYQLFGY